VPASALICSRHVSVPRLVIGIVEPIARSIFDRVDSRSVRTRVLRRLNSWIASVSAADGLRSIAGERASAHSSAQRSVRASPMVPARMMGMPNVGLESPCMWRAQPGRRSMAACIPSAWTGAATQLGGGPLNTSCATWRARASHASCGLMASIRSRASRLPRGIGSAPSAPATCAVSAKYRSWSAPDMPGLTRHKGCRSAACPAPVHGSAAHARSPRRHQICCRTW
jgi:hypothetical protein